MPIWPKHELLQHGPDLPMAERVRRYQHNVRTIRASGCAVPTSVHIDRPHSLKPVSWPCRRHTICSRATSGLARH